MAQERGITFWLSIVARYHRGALQDFYCTRGDLIDFLNCRNEFHFSFPIPILCHPTLCQKSSEKKSI